jgi:hypothetical protein
MEEIWILLAETDLRHDVEITATGHYIVVF